MNAKTTIQLIVSLVITFLLASSAFFFFPQYKDLAPVIFVSFAASISQLGAVIYLLLSLNTMKPRLKLAYTLFAAGILLFSLVLLVPSTSVFTDVISNSPLINNLLVVAPYVLGVLLMYLGLRKFAQILEIKGFEIRWLWVAVGAALAWVAVAVTPHEAIEGESALAFALIFGFMAWAAVYGAAATRLALRLRQGIGDNYRASMTWTALAMFAVTFAAIHELITKAYFRNSTYALTGWSIWPFLMVGLILLATSISFKAAGRRAVELPADASSVDVVTALAALVSRPREVDPLLDKVRAITSSRGAKDLTDADKQTLVTVYLQIEDYLVTKDPLRQYSREGLRENLPEAFLQTLPTTATA